MKIGSRAGLLLCAVTAGCASGDAVTLDAGIGDIFFADAGRVPSSPGDAAPPKMPIDAGFDVDAAWPDAATLPDAMPAPDAAPGCTDQELQLLDNGDFESGAGLPWHESSGLGVSIITTDFGAAQSGTYVAWLGGYNDAVDVVYQEISVPAGATDLQVAGYIGIGTEESSGQWDRASVDIRTSAGALLETLGSWSNEDAGSDWQAFTLVPSGDYQGQTIRISFHASTDATLITNFVFDTMAVRATVCQ